MRCKYATDSPDYLAYPCGIADCPACPVGEPDPEPDLIVTELRAARETGGGVTT